MQIKSQQNTMQHLSPPAFLKQAIGTQFTQIDMLADD